jgi:hypothetical protein
VPLADLCESQTQLVGKSLDPTSPSITPSDHRRLDEKTLPAARRPELPALDNGLAVGGQDFRLGAHCGLIGSVGRDLRD